MFFSGVLFLFISCKEELPGIIMVDEAKPLLDTSYLMAIPTASAKKVLLFDITGVRCNNCPKAAVVAKKLLALTPNSLVVVALYPKTPPSLTFPWAGFDTMSTIESEQIASALGGIGSLPLGSVDQFTFNGSKLIVPSDWASAIALQMVKSSPFNLHIKSTWNTPDGRARIEVKVITNKSATGNYKWAMGITENRVISKQSDADTSSGFRDDYMHEHVLRACIGSSLGIEIGNNMPAGWVREKHFYVLPKAKWKPENLDLVVWIYDANTKEVLQVEKAKLK
ncbi:MAG: hypothetical protein CK532_02810 [Flavobacteriales bacterium]|nr:MAG: hypothetical protein CK532_02810 [Flavobacteriales bacterium]